MEKQLILAAEKGDSAEIARLLDAGVEINYRNTFGRTALAVAAYEGHLEACRTLLTRGANPNLPDFKNRTPLFWAAHKGHTDIVIELLDRGYILNENDKKLLNIELLRAAQYGKLAQITFLLKLGADINYKDHNHFTALHHAVYYNHPDACRTLINEGIDINLTDLQSQTALWLAADKGHSEIASVLLAHNAKMDTACKKEKTAFVIACEKHHIQVILELVDHGYKLNTHDLKALNRLLHEAAELGQCLQIDKLLEIGAGINSEEYRGNTALHYAASNGRDGALALLIERGADINSKNKRKETALHLAISGGHEAACKLLLKEGAEVNTDESYSCSAIRLAIRFGIPNIAKMLFENGAAMVGEASKSDSVNEILHQEVLRIAKKVKSYLASHKAAMRQHKWILHSTIAYVLEMHANLVLDAKTPEDAINQYGELRYLFRKRFNQELAKEPCRDTANHKLLALNDLARFILDRDVFGKPTKTGFRAEIEDSLPAYNDKILTQAQSIRALLDREDSPLNEKAALFGLIKPTSQIISEQVNIIISNMKSEPAALRTAYEAYDKLVEVLTNRFKSEQALNSSSQCFSDKTKTLNELFKLVLGKEIRSELAPIADTTEQVTVTPSAPPIDFALETGEASITPAPHAGAGVSREQLARERLEALTLTGVVASVFLESAERIEAVPPKPNYPTLLGEPIDLVGPAVSTATAESARSDQFELLLSEQLNAPTAPLPFTTTEIVEHERDAEPVALPA